jgi:hypothetical protein
MLKTWHKLLLGVVVACLFMGNLPILAQTPDRSAADYTYGDCTRVDQTALRTQIEQTALAVLAEESGGIEIAQVVERKWVELHVDDTINSEVKQAVNRVYNEEGYFSRLWSGWSGDKAEEYATRIADDAFGGAAFMQQIDALAAAIAGEISSEIEADFARAASVAFLCMKAYVGEQYSATLFSAFERAVSVELQQVEVAADTAVDISALDVHQKALGGIGVIVVTEIVRRVTQKLSQKIAERIAGRIAGRVLGRAGSSFIPVAGWVIGLGLIVWDLWEGGYGALPQIEEALTSEEVKAKIRSEVTDAIRIGLPDETAVVALEIAVSVIEEWNGFCDRYPNVCSIAEENSTFRQILNETPLEQLDRVATLVNMLVDYAGRAELTNTLDSGQFDALLALPESADEILQASRSVTTVLAWAGLAGAGLDQVVDYGVYRQKTPEDFDQTTLAAVLAVDDEAAIEKLLALDRTELQALVNFAGTSLGPMAGNMSLAELRQLLAYLAQPVDVTRTPPQDLASKLASREMTVEELLAPAPVVTPTATPRPIEQTQGGERPPYDNSIVIATGVLAVLVLLAFGWTVLQRWQSRLQRQR